MNIIGGTNFLGGGSGRIEIGDNTASGATVAQLNFIDTVGTQSMSSINVAQRTGRGQNLLLYSGGTNLIQTVGNLDIGQDSGLGTMRISNGAVITALRVGDSFRLGNQNSDGLVPTGRFEVVDGGLLQSMSVTSSVQLGTVANGYAVVNLGNMQGGSLTFLNNGDQWRLGNGSFTVTNAVIDMNRFSTRNIEVGSSWDGNNGILNLINSQVTMTNLTSSDDGGLLIGRGGSSRTGIVNIIGGTNFLGGGSGRIEIGDNTASGATVAQLNFINTVGTQSMTTINVAQRTGRGQNLLLYSGGTNFIQTVNQLDIGQDSGLGTMRVSNGAVITALESGARFQDGQWQFRQSGAHGPVGGGRWRSDPVDVRDKLGCARHGGQWIRSGQSGQYAGRQPDLSQFRCQLEVGQWRLHRDQCGCGF